jgi:cytochrome c oxidase subunit II
VGRWLAAPEHPGSEAGQVEMGRARRLTSTAGMLAVVALLLAGCGAYTPVTEQGKDVHWLYNLLFVVATVIFLLVEGAILFAVIRYRRRGDALPPQFHGNNLLEVAWTLIPLLIVATLFVLTWGVLTKVNARADNPRVTLNVVGFQWQWRFTYQGEKVQVEKGEPAKDLTIKGTIAKPPEIYLPVGEPIAVNEQSEDVIHSFFIPEFLFKKDAFPDHTNSFALTITRPGVYHGQCAQYCGLAHGQMHFYIHAVPDAEYRAWLAKAKKQAASGCPADTTPGQIAAQNVSFDKDCLSAKAGRPFTITFDNKEPVLHNIAIFEGANAEGRNVFRGQKFTGPKVEKETVPALKAGSYFFHCDVHPQAMQGKLVVK